MFEFDSSKTLRAEEYERKPNLCVAEALRIGILTQLLCLLLNEIGLFHVGKGVMRVCVILGVLCCLVPQAIAANEKLSTNPKSKYVVLICTCAMCFVMSLALFIFSAPLALLPMLLAVQYNSRRVSQMAIGGTCLCVALAPPLGCMMSLWSSEFLRFLLSSALGGEVVVERLEQATGVMTQGALGVVMYVSFPWILCIMIMGKLVLSATERGEAGMENQVKVIRMSRLDALTGLYNQNVYDQYLKSPVGEETVGVLFFDVDGLKRTNDEQGHEYGDLLLRRCAESLQPLFDEICHGFRIGGDEFLVVVDTEDPDVLEKKAELWRKSMERINLENRTRHQGLYCHMSMGTAFGKKYDLSTLIIRADSRMYEEKEEYHRTVAPR